MPFPRPPSFLFFLFPSPILKSTVPDPDSPGGSGTTAKTIHRGLVGPWSSSYLNFVGASFFAAAGPVSVANDQEAHRAVQSTDITPVPAASLSPEDSELQAVRARANTAAAALRGARKIVQGPSDQPKQKYPAN